MVIKEQIITRPQVVVGILFFEKVEQTIECVRSFLPSMVPIFVCNNGSSTESRNILTAFTSQYSQVQILDAPHNLGVSGGRNLLIESTDAEWIFFVDNDITVQTQNWLHILTSHIQESPDVEAFIPRLYNVFERTYSPRHQIRIHNKHVTFTNRARSKRVNLFPGGASIVRSTVFKRIGLYDAQMFVNYEDYELCLRGVLNNEPINASTIEDITLRHDHRRVTTDQDRKYVAIRYDSDRTQSSAKRIFDKYGLYIQDNSSAWTKSQKNNLLQGRNWWKKETLFYLVPPWIKNFWNNR
jgi:GT2 family glycosyltransferase